MRHLILVMHLHPISTSPLLSCQEADGNVRETLASYLKRYERDGSVTDRVMTIAGAFHYIEGEHEDRIAMFYRWLLIGGVVVNFIAMVTMSFYESTIWFAFVSYIAQSFILYPVVILASKRVKEPVTRSQMDCMSDTLAVCKLYFFIAAGLTIIYFFFVIIATFSAKFSPTFIYAGFFGGVCVFAVAFLNVWGLFFIVLDAKAAQEEIRKLSNAVIEETLTIAQYDAVHEKLRDVKNGSSQVADGIALVAYLSVAMCVISFLFAHAVEEAYSMDNASASGQRNAYVLMLVGSVCLQTREAFLILLALPSIAEVNELYGELLDQLARSEWNHAAPSSITLSTIGDEYTIKPNDVVANYKNNVCLRLLAAAMTRPLCMYVLGRPVKRTEMKAQLITVAFMVGSSLTAYCLNVAMRRYS